MLELILILSAGAFIPSVIFYLHWNELQLLSFWRITIAFLFVVDIAAGVVANLTRSTNDFYALRPKMRFIFYSIHIHLIIIFLSLQYPLFPAMFITAYAILTSLIVNAFNKKDFHQSLAGTFIVIGVSIIPLFFHLTMIGWIVSLLFMIKLIISFSINHFQREYL